MKYIINIDDQTFEVEIEDLRARPIIAFVDGERVEVEPQDVHPPLTSAQSSLPLTRKSAPAPVAVPAASAAASPTAKTKIVRAPIPGVIVALLVRPGDEVKHGQELCTIEAMKMRNTIRSSRPGRIAEILVTPGQTVNHNDPLLSFEE